MESKGWGMTQKWVVLGKRRIQGVVERIMGEWIYLVKNYNEAHY